MLAGLSDVTLLASRQFSTDHQLDRSQTVFPARYVSAIGSRLGMASKGEGAQERMALGKICGAKGVFQSVYRPKILNLRYALMQASHRKSCDMLPSPLAAAAVDQMT